MGKMMKVPQYEATRIGTRRISSSDLLKAYKEDLNHLPSFIAELKKTDNKGWQRILDAVMHDASKRRDLMRLIKVKKYKGQDVVSIGDPNWFSHPVVTAAAGAFLIGWAIGTACYKAGPCNFVS